MQKTKRQQAAIKAAATRKANKKAKVQPLEVQEARKKVARRHSNNFLRQKALRNFDLKNK